MLDVRKLSGGIRNVSNCVKKVSNDARNLADGVSKVSNSVMKWQIV